MKIIIYRYNVHCLQHKMFVINICRIVGRTILDILYNLYPIQMYTEKKSAYACYTNLTYQALVFGVYSKYSGRCRLFAQTQF